MHIKLVSSDGTYYEMTLCELPIDVLEENDFNDMNVKLVSRYQESNDYVQINIEDKNYQGVLYLYGLDNALFERDGTFRKERFLMVIDERFVEAKQKLRTANQSMLLKDKFFERSNDYLSTISS